MKDHKIQLVIPRSLHEPYKAEQRQWLMTLDDFIAVVTERDRHKRLPSESLRGALYVNHRPSGQWRYRPILLLKSEHEHSNIRWGRSTWLFLRVP